MNHGGDLLPLLPKIISEGGHVSIGLGDWPYIDTIPDISTPTNAEVVNHVAALARSMDRNVATPAEAAVLLGLAEKR